MPYRALGPKVLLFQGVEVDSFEKETQLLSIRIRNKLSISSGNREILSFMSFQRRAGELMLIYSRILPHRSIDRYYYIMYAANELTEGLSCHTSIASLESREQFYEFVFCVYKLSQVLTEMSKVQYGPDTTTPMANFANVLFSLACQLYDHYCSFEKKVQHNEWSSLLIQTTLHLLSLRKIPATENPQKPAVPQPIKSLKELDKSYLPSDKSYLPSDKSYLPSDKSSAVPDKPQLDGKLSDRSNKDLISEVRDPPSSDIKDQATVATDEGNLGATNEEVADDSFRLADTSVTQDTSDDLLGESDSGIRSAATTFDTAELESKLTIDDEGIDISDHDASNQRIRPVTSGIVSEQRIQAKDSETIDRPYLGNETTCTTADGGDGNGGFERRLQQTMATFEGHMNTKEKDASEIQNTLSIIKHGKVRIHSKFYSFGLLEVLRTFFKILNSFIFSSIEKFICMLSFQVCKLLVKFTYNSQILNSFLAWEVHMHSKFPSLQLFYGIYAPP